MKKFIPYGRQDINKDDIRAVIDVLQSEWITQGSRIAHFEQALAKYCGAQYAVCVSSGTAALHIACLAVGLQKGNEAITTPITFLATANAIIYASAHPVFADVEYDTLTINPSAIRNSITSKTKAIVPVHFAGHPCQMVHVSEIAREKKLIVIEDASHALGSQYKCNGRWIKVGGCQHSDITIFSFHPVKHITTGEGGAILTNRKDLYEECLALRNHGVIKETEKFCNPLRVTDERGAWYYEMQMLGFNYRITDIQCALGISQLKRLKDFLVRRREIAQWYNTMLSAVEEIELPKERAQYKSAWHLYTVRLKDAQRRRPIFEALRKRNIGVQVHYIPIYLQPYYRRHFRYQQGICLIAEDYYQRALTLPLYPKMRKADVRYVVTTLKRVLK
jgi:UDP-4-amino-4,6-dideoxy-N-acetyl-beta-L-altrosamine transaminase